MEGQSTHGSLGRGNVFFFETFHKIQIIYFIISYDITELTDRIFYLMEKISKKIFQKIFKKKASII